MQRVAYLAGLLTLTTLGTSGCKKRHVEVSGDASSPFEQSYDSPNGLVRVHYPKSFAASITGKNVILLRRNLGGGEDEALTFVSIGKPISNDVKEFARVAIDASQKKEAEVSNSFQETSRRTTKCFGEDMGVETVATLVTKSGVKYSKWGCAFLHGEHGYSFGFITPEHLASEHEPLLRQIVQGADLL